MMLPFQTGQASMIGPDQVNSTATATAQLDRDVVVNFLSRSQTVDQFTSLGLDAQSAMDRVAAMTDAEVSLLAGKVNAVPAGGDGLLDRLRAHTRHSRAPDPGHAPWRFPMNEPDFRLEQLLDLWPDRFEGIDPRPVVSRHSLLARKIAGPPPPRQLGHLSQHGQPIV